MRNSGQDTRCGALRGLVATPRSVDRKALKALTGLPNCRCGSPTPLSYTCKSVGAGKKSYRADVKNRRKAG
jgi:hypothetical protein